MKRFWNWVRDETDPEMRVLRLEGAIAEESWLDDDVTPAAFKSELISGNGPITVWINSPGGDCIAAAQIYNMLMDYPSDVTVKIDGIAASAASVIAMAGTTVMMSPTSLLMVHNPMTAAMGDTEDMRKAIQLLEEVKESIINSYEIKTGLSRARLSHLMDQETWMNAKKALDLGFCDVIMFDRTDDPDEDDDTGEDGDSDKNGDPGKEKEKNAKKASVLTAYTFSERVCDAMLMNMLRAQCKTAEAAPVPTPETTAPETKTASVPEQVPVSEPRVHVSDLEKRLALLRY